MSARPARPVSFTVRRARSPGSDRHASRLCRATGSSARSSHGALPDRERPQPEHHAGRWRRPAPPCPCAARHTDRRHGLPRAAAGVRLRDPLRRLGPTPAPRDLRADRRRPRRTAGSAAGAIASAARPVSARSLRLGCHEAAGRRRLHGPIPDGVGPATCIRSTATSRHAAQRVRADSPGRAGAPARRRCRATATGPHISGRRRSVPGPARRRGGLRAGTGRPWPTTRSAPRRAGPR